MLKALLRPSFILIPLTMGLCIPQAHVLNDPPYNAVRWALTVMIFISCLKVSFRDLRPRAEHLRLLVLNLLLGIVPYLLIRTFLPEQGDLAKAAFFVGITPTATAAPVILSFLNARVGFALTGFTVSNIGICLSFLVLLPWVTGTLTFDFVGRVAWTLMQVILLPFGAAALAQKLFPAIRELPGRLKTFSFLLWSFTLFVIASIARYDFQTQEISGWSALSIAAVSLVLCVCNFWFGRLVAPKRLRRECSQLLGQKNTSLTIYLALHYANALVALGPIFYVIYHNTWNAWQIYRYDRRKQRRQPPRAAMKMKNDE